MVLTGFPSRRLINSGWRYIRLENRINQIERQTSTRSCGIIVTGDEVLKGEVQDTNSHFLCEKLHDLGIRVQKISSVPDELYTISAEVKAFSVSYDYVLTTGGIGPTPDDVTYESVAKAFGVGLVYHPVLTQICFDFFKTGDINHPALKLARIPSTARLTFGIDPISKTRVAYPNVSIGNVYIFPGVPHMMRSMFNSVSKELFIAGEQFHVREMYLNTTEDLVTSHLNKTVAKFPDVMFGSYPKFFHSYYTLKLTLESTSKKSADVAYEYLKSGIPESFHVNYDKYYSRDKKRKVHNFNYKLLIDTIEEVKSVLLSFAPDNMFLYFDGGKNSTVLLYVLSLLYEEHFVGSQINCVFVEQNIRVVPFVKNSSKEYDVNLIKFSANNFRRFFENNSDVLLIKGTRKSDPEAHSIFKSFEGLKVFNPLVNWNYKDIWNVLRGLYVPYCDLYDNGYTSICLPSARPNPHLKITGSREDLVYYKKACELADGSLENSF